MQWTRVVAGVCFDLEFSSRQGMFFKRSVQQYLIRVMDLVSEVNITGSTILIGVISRILIFASNNAW